MTSIFQRPRARPPLSSTSSQQNLVDVSNEDELLAALTSLPRSDGACYGRGVNIVGDIVLKNPVRLSTQHSGLLITSSSNSRVTTKRSIESCFVFSQNTNGSTIEKLTITSDTNATNFVRLTNNNNNTVRSIYKRGGSLAVNLVSAFASSRLSVTECKGDGTPAKILLNTCTFFLLANNTYLSAGEIANSFGGVVSGNAFITSGFLFDAGSYCSVSGNSLAGNISVINAGSDYAIVGNALFGGNIDTSGGFNNTIVGNTGVGTITNAATDAVTSNT